MNNRGITNGTIVIILIAMFLAFYMLFVLGWQDARSSGEAWSQMCYAKFSAKEIDGGVLAVCGVTPTAQATIEDMGYPAPRKPKPTVDYPYQPPPDYSNETPLPTMPFPTSAPTPTPVLP